MSKLCCNIHKLGLFCVHVMKVHTFEHARQFSVAAAFVHCNASFEP